jgi:hypothetical protein
MLHNNRPVHQQEEVVSMLIFVLMIMVVITGPGSAWTQNMLDQMLSTMSVLKILRVLRHIVLLYSHACPHVTYIASLTFRSSLFSGCFHLHSGYSGYSCAFCSCSGHSQALLMQFLFSAHVGHHAQATQVIVTHCHCYSLSSCHSHVTCIML